MSSLISQQDYDKALKHYGVLGMKWGKTRAKGDGYDIRTARTRLAKDRADLVRATRKSNTIKDPAKREAARAEVQKMRVDFLKNPDRVLASRLTRGEKAVGLMLGFGVAPIAITSVASRRIERKQETGKYDKK